MVRRIKDYLFRKAVADMAAVAVIALMLGAFSPALLEVFNFNSGWMSTVWSSTVAPQLPREVALAGDALSAARDVAIKGQRVLVNTTETVTSSTKRLRDVRSFREFRSGEWISRGNATRGPMIETWTRLFLLGEAWVFKIQLSMLLRLPFSIRRLVRWARRKDDELVLEPRF